MKKFLALVLVLILTFSMALVSCDEILVTNGDASTSENGDTNGNSENGDESKDIALESEESADTTPKTAKELYESVAAELALIKNATIVAEQNVEMTMTFAGQNISSITKQTTTQKIDNDKLQLISTYAEEVILDVRYIDGIVYNVPAGDGEKIKYEINVDEMKELFGFDSQEEVILDVPETMFENVTLLEENGKMYIELSFGKSEFEKLFPNMDEIGDLSTLEDISYKIYFTAEGKLDSLVMSTKLDGEIEGQPFEATIVSVITYINIGTTVVEAPADADSYVVAELPEIN